MARKQERRSLPLSVDEWKQLEMLAEKFDTTAPTGTSVGSPSWRSLIKAIAKGDLLVCEIYEVVEIVVEDESETSELQEV